MEEHEVLYQEGEQIDSLYLVCNGTLSVEVGGALLGHLSAGQFIGAQNYFEPEEPSHATFTSEEPTFLLTWKLPRLRRLLQQDMSLQSLTIVSAGPGRRFHLSTKPA
eukprot:scaffold569_cov408-Prasinococcus_capsulatus_cf.AAC.23